MISNAYSNWQEYLYFAASARKSQLKSVPKITKSNPEGDRSPEMLQTLGRGRYTNSFHNSVNRERRLKFLSWIMGKILPRERELAQKGVATSFYPKDGDRQKEE